MYIDAEIESARSIDNLINDDNGAKSVEHDIIKQIWVASRDLVFLLTRIDYNSFKRQIRG